MADATSTTYPLGPWYPTNGYTCWRCGVYVAWGTAHYCSYPADQLPTVTVKPLTWTLEVDVSDYELKNLAEIVEALDKARASFGRLSDYDDKGAGNRTLAYLAARYGVKEEALIDVLVEES